ncbi:MAG: amino acid adenylation domain-containing protein, partial [bacterium]|nr:amino acid adenylation domain-containing protein [bacterium]
MSVNKETLNVALASTQNIKERDYWMNRLSGQLSITNFPYDFKKTGTVYQTAVVTHTMEQTLCARLLKLINKSDIRLFVVLAALLVVLLEKYTGSKDIVIGTSISKQENDENLINSVLALRNRLTETLTFKELLLQVRGTFKEAMEHQDYPFDTLLYKLGLQEEGEGDNSALFDTILILKNLQDINYVRSTKAGLMFAFEREGEEIHCEVEYNSELYEKNTVEKILGHYMNLIGNILEDINRETSQIEIMTEEEKRQLLEEFNETDSPYPQSETLHRLFEKQVEKSPHRVAMVFEELQVTYRQLNERSNRLAGMLQKKGVGADTIVGLMVEPSAEVIIAIMGTLKAGGAYLPIDSDYPDARKKYILEDSGCRILLTQKKLVDKNNNPLDCLSTEDIFFLDEPGTYTSGPDKPDNGVKSNNLAYVMYTSGITGRPKGVLIEHRNAVNVVHWFGKTFNMNAETHLLQLTDYTFDPSVEDIFGTLLHGGVIYVPATNMVIEPQKFADYMNRKLINIIDFVPMALKELLTRYPKFDSLRVVISGGEKLEDSLKAQLLSLGYEVYNNYGPTEVTVDALSAKCGETKVNLGTPISNSRAYMLSIDNRLLPIGVPGELCISGAGIARGYLNNPELTSEKFAVNPFVEGQGIYRTGDLARWLPDGTVDFLGRIDYQVKIRGFRIELGEIERQLNKQPEIKDAVVITRENKNDERFLIALVISEDELDVPKLKNKLSKDLPHYMLPMKFIRMEDFPKTPSGKIDRKTLEQSAGLQEQTEVTYVEPKTDMEKLIADIWKETLAVEKVGIDDNFFELGGNSLNIAQLSHKLKEKLKKDITVVTLFDNPTINLFLQYIDESENDSAAMEKTAKKRK